MIGVILAAGIAAGVAATGLAIGSTALVILGGIFVVIGIYTLLKRNSSNRP